MWSTSATRAVRRRVQLASSSASWPRMRLRLILAKRDGRGTGSGPQKERTGASLSTAAAVAAAVMFEGTEEGFEEPAAGVVFSDDADDDADDDGGPVVVVVAGATAEGVVVAVAACGVDGLGVIVLGKLVEAVDDADAAEPARFAGGAAAEVAFVALDVAIAAATAAARFVIEADALGRCRVLVILPPCVYAMAVAGAVVGVTLGAGKCDRV